MLFKNMLFTVLVCIAGNAFAAPNAEPFPLKAESTEQFRQQAQALRSEMATGRYASLSIKDKKRVEKQLDKLDDLYVKRATGAKIEDSDAVALVNASSEINAVLGGDDGDRLICEQVKPLGSNRIQKVCMTAAQREEKHREDQREIRGNRNANPITR